MRTLVKLLFAALIVHAAYRVGMAYWDHYQFQDEVQQLAQFSERSTPPELAKGILDLAADRGIPLDPEDLSVNRRQRRIDILGTYVRDVLLVPGYQYPWTFTLDVTVLTIN
ncbi:MAG TPA: hypothetical protein VF198_08955 [Vicinamibacterales bacterium]